MPGHGKFQPSAQGMAVDRHHHGLGIAFQLLEEPVHLGAVVPAAGQHNGKFVNVGACAKCLSASGNHQRANAGIGIRCGKRFLEPFADVQAEGVGWGIVESNNGNTILCS